MSPRRHPSDPVLADYASGALRQAFAVVVALGAAVSFGMVLGAALGWWLLHRVLAGPVPGVGAALLAGLAAAVPAAAAGGALARFAGDAGLVVALLLAVVVGDVLILTFGQSPGAVYKLLLDGTWGNAYGFGQVLYKATTLTFTGLAVGLGLRAGLFNIGAESQLAAGGFVAAVAGMLLPAGLPALGTAIFGIRVQGDFAATAERSRATADRLEKISRALAGDGVGLSRAGDLFEQAARAMLADLGEWRLAQHHRELALP